MVITTRAMGNFIFTLTDGSNYQYYKDNMKTIALIFLLSISIFSQEKQDSTELANIANQFQRVQKELQQSEARTVQCKAILFDLQNAYTEKLKAIEEKKKKKEVE